MSIPTIAEEYMKLMENLRHSEENCAMIAHLRNAEGGAKGRNIARGWLAIAEAVKTMRNKVTVLAQGKLQ